MLQQVWGRLTFFIGVFKKPNPILQREGVAEAGSVSAKLYQLYAMIANDRFVKDIKEKIAL